MDIVLWTLRKQSSSVAMKGGVGLSKFRQPYFGKKCFTCYVRVFLLVFSVGIWPSAIAMLGCYLGCSSLYIWLSFPDVKRVSDC
jgi:hypothetical protein